MNGEQVACGASPPQAHGAGALTAAPSSLGSAALCLGGAGVATDPRSSKASQDLELLIEKCILYLGRRPHPFLRSRHHHRGSRSVCGAGISLERLRVTSVFTTARCLLTRRRLIALADQDRLAELLDGGRSSGSSCPWGGRFGFPGLRPFLKLGVLRGLPVAHLVVGRPRASSRPCVRLVALHGEDSSAVPWAVLGKEALLFHGLSLRRPGPTRPRRRSAPVST